MNSICLMFFLLNAPLTFSTVFTNWIAVIFSPYLLLCHYKNLNSNNVNKTGTVGATPVITVENLPSIGRRLDGLLCTKRLATVRNVSFIPLATRVPNPSSEFAFHCVIGITALYAYGLWASLNTCLLYAQSALI
jgi:hypothetical protein